LSSGPACWVCSSRLLTTFCCSWALSSNCTLPRSDRIFGWMLPNCHPIARCLLHREFGKSDCRALS
jgi:hypothetical protein